MATIALVDDDPEVLGFYTEVLAEAGHQVHPFTTGREAARACVECRFAMVICDVNMPDIDGTQLMQTIRAQRPHMPFIFISGNPAHHFTQAIMGADRFFVKADNPDVLLRMVESVLQVKGVDAGSSETDKQAVVGEEQ
ncbi:MAG: response regulator [Planctomycetota bacterium]